MKKLTFEELRKMNKEEWKQAVLVFKQESFDKPYTEIQRSYSVDSSAKYFNGNMNGNSLFGNCLDGTDTGVRLDHYMHCLPSDGIGQRWLIDYCYITE